VLEARDLAVQGGDLVWIGDLRHDDDIGVPGHDAGQVGVPFGFQRIDANGGNDAGGPPTPIKIGGERPGLGPQLGWREVLKFLDQHVGAARARGGERHRIGARHKQPAAPQRGRAAPNTRGGAVGGGARDASEGRGSRHGKRQLRACIVLGLPNWLRPI
jgi:hypothetical protein